MSEQATQICPWCQMEIVWDAETGPEEECPHCFNELEDYRTLTLELDNDEEAIGEADLYSYEQKVRNYVEGQDPTQTLECEQCHEAMIVAGEMKLESAQFAPRLVSGLPPFVEGPIELQAHVCPSCFQWKTVLTEAKRLEIIQKLQQGD